MDTVYVEILSGEFKGWKGYKYYNHDKMQETLRIFIFGEEVIVLAKKHAHREIKKHESIK